MRLKKYKGSISNSNSRLKAATSLVLMERLRISIHRLQMMLKHQSAKRQKWLRTLYTFLIQRSKTRRIISIKTRTCFSTSIPKTLSQSLQIWTKRNFRRCQTLASSLSTSNLRIRIRQLHQLTDATTSSPCLSTQYQAFSRGQWLSHLKYWMGILSLKMKVMVQLYASQECHWSPKPKQLN
jgi:hypothetical protein